MGGVTLLNKNTIVHEDCNEYGQRICQTIFACTGMTVNENDL